MLRVHKSTHRFSIRIPAGFNHLDTSSWDQMATLTTDCEHPDAIITDCIPTLPKGCSAWALTLIGEMNPADTAKFNDLKRIASLKGIILFDLRDRAPIDLALQNALDDVLKLLQTGSFNSAANLERVDPPLGLTKTRLCIFSENRKGTLARVTGYVSDLDLNIQALDNQGNEDIGYSLIDIARPVTNTVLPELEKRERFPEIIRVREIQFY